MSNLQEWINAVLMAADAEGTANAEVIPTWPADCVERFPDRFPQLTVGALRDWQTRPKFTALCQSKTKQIGKPVGYLVQNEAGGLAAVHNLGRVTWLDDCVAGPVEREDNAQDGGGLEVQKEFWDKAWDFSNEFIDGYEFIGDKGYYTPGSKERLLIKDCVSGLLSEMEESSFIGSRAQQPSAVVQKPNMFWDDSNPEMSQESEYDLADYCAQDLPCGESMLVDVMCAEMLPNRTMKVWIDNEDDGVHWEWVQPQKQEQES
jgi:hypothetical protein